MERVRGERGREEGEREGGRGGGERREREREREIEERGERWRTGYEYKLDTLINMRVPRFVPLWC